MIRRMVIFKDRNTRKLFVTPEFNGDKEGFEARGKCLGGCSKDWEEILDDFVGVETLDDFKRASEIAQGYYFSFVGDDPLPINEIESIEDVKSDYVYLIEDGNISQI